jgi:hypothetical protein
LDYYNDEQKHDAQIPDGISSTRWIATGSWDGRLQSGFIETVKVLWKTMKMTLRTK